MKAKGGNPASQAYVRNKEKACHEVGIVSHAYRLGGEIHTKSALYLHVKTYRHFLELWIYGP